MNRIIFLDIDGVLNSDKFGKWCASEDGKDFIKNGGKHTIDPNAVMLIRDLCMENNVKLVISSTWRNLSLEGTISDFNHYRDLAVLSHYIVGITPRINVDTRGEEINWFLKHRNDIPDSKYNNFFDFDFFKNTKRDLEYCIIDDDNDMLPEQMEHFVKTDFLTGVTKDDINKVKIILKITNE